MRALVLPTLAIMLAAACGGARPSPRTGVAVRGGGTRPEIRVIAREGDPRGAVAAAVVTSGIAEARGAEVPVALAGLVEARLRALGVADAQVVAGAEGYRVRALVSSPTEASAFVRALRVALLSPAQADAGGLASARRKVGALAHRPLPDAALTDAARCTGAAYGAPPQAQSAFAAEGRPAPQPDVAAPDLAAAGGARGDGTGPAAAELEAWRAAAHGLGRVAIATAGDGALGEAAHAALAADGAWPRAAGAPASLPLPPIAEPLNVYELAPDAAPGSARATIAVYMQRPAQAAAIAVAVGDPRGALAARLAALDGPPRVREVAAGAHVGGGCLAVTLEWGARSFGTSGPVRIATAVALARQEIAVELAGRPAEPRADVDVDAALQAADPRDAAERAAWWTLTTARESAELRVSTAIGIGHGREATARAAYARAAREIRAAIDRALVSWNERVVETRARVEHGQGERGLLLASPCGTLAEAEHDAGLGALVAAAAAEHVTDGLRGEGARAEPWAAQDGVGIVVHAPPRPGEAPLAHARRVADAAARAFVAETPPASALARARGLVRARLTEQDASRTLPVLAGALAPSHPSWVLPWGTSDAVGRASDAAIASRAAALRAGPLRVAVLANADAAQAEAVAQAVDRWVVRRPYDARACPSISPAPPAKVGTHTADGQGGLAEALLALPLAAVGRDADRDPTARAAMADAAAILASALDGDDGLLARALAERGLARGASAHVLGGPRAAALVLRVVAPPGNLDAAVAEVRAAISRVRAGGLTDADLARATTARDRAALGDQLDPRARLAALFRDDRPRPAPSGDAVRALAAALLRDDALMVIAAQPRPRAPADPRDDKDGR